MAEYSGVAKSAALDKTSCDQGTDAGVTSGYTAAVGAAGDLIFAGVGVFDHPITVRAGGDQGVPATLRSQLSGPDGTSADEDVISQAAGIQNATFALSADTPSGWAACLAAFHPASLGMPNGRLNAVSCSTPSSCTAVGDYVSSSGTRRALAERLTGSSWQLQSAAEPSGATSSTLLGVSCTSTVGCVAVGDYVNSAGAQLTLAERWDGSSWKVQSTPGNPPGLVTGVALNGVSCSSSTACTAVGTYDSNDNVTLVERWNGSDWATQSHTDPPVHDILNGVSCPTTSACSAVGLFYNGGFYATLADGWNASRWQLENSANPAGSHDAELDGVSCTSAAACTAVGRYSASNPFATLAERWNGTTWTIQSTPNPADTPVGLAAVSCSSQSVCSAVGYSGAPGSASAQPLAERWSASAWQSEATPHPLPSALTGVSCASASACTAVGSQLGSGGTEQTLAQGWNGATWQIETTPNPLP